MDMEKCVIPECPNTTSKFQSDVGKAINYVHMSGKEFRICPTCFKKILLSLVAQLSAADGNAQREARIRLAKMVHDETVIFEGQDESYAKLQIRQS